MSATRVIQSSALALVLLAQPAGAQNYIHGLLAKYKPQQLAINDCMFSVSQGGAFHACMFRAGYRFCSNCRILGIGGYSCDRVPGSTTSAPCWIEAEEMALATEGPPDITPNPSKDPQCEGYTAKQCYRLQTTGCPWDIADLYRGCRVGYSRDADEIAASHPAVLGTGHCLPRGR